MQLFADNPIAMDTPILERIAQTIGWHGYELGALISIILVSAICGLVGAMVVGNRMAFFSDAMAHCAFSGITLGLIIAASGVGLDKNSNAIDWVVPLIMAAFGALVGIGIAYVRERTGLASDTVIGVFFAAAIGFAAMLLTAFQHLRLFDPERFLFGGPSLVKFVDLVLLAVLFVLTLAIMIWKYNDFLLASFNPSLAKSRGITVTLNNYIFILLLAMIVNFCISAVGVMLINALLIVPAAAASNLSLNLRQMFRNTLFISLGIGLVGLFVSQTVQIRIAGDTREFGPSGTIVCLGVLVFIFSMLISYLREKFKHLG